MKYENDPRITPQSRYDARVHHNIALIGGFLGVYPILNFHNFFGSAQTVNLIEMVTGFEKCEFQPAFYHLGAACLYMFAVALTTYIPKHCSLKIQYLSLAIDMLCAIIMAFLPSGLSPILCLYPSFFCMAFQWCSFPGAYGYTSSTIFSTNNIRQMTAALTEVYLNHDTSQMLKARFFGSTLLFYHIGVASCYLLWLRFGRMVSLFAVIPIAAAFINMNYRKPVK